MKLLITGAVSWKSEQLNQLEKMGHTICFMQNEKDQLPCSYEDVEGVICNGLFLYHSIEKFTSLRYIQLTSAGFDRVPMDYVKSHGIEIYNARGVYSIPMSEFAISGVLQLYKKSQFFLNNKEQKKWIKNREVRQLNGSEVLIVGCGNVGEHCAKLFNVFNCSVYGIDLYPIQKENFIEVLGLDRLEEKLSSADIVVLTLPLTEQTQGLFDKNKFAKMKKDSVLVNIARGKVVETVALIEALKNKLYGAVLDVFEEEPLDENSKLWDLENVILTPHNSFVGNGNLDRLYKVIITNWEGK